MLPKCI